MMAVRKSGACFMTRCRCFYAVQVLCVLLFAAGCATTVQVQARFPANNAAAAQLRRIAVADFYGPEGDRFAYSFEAMLATAEFDGQRYFVMLDSGGRGRGADGVSAAAYGRSIGADGVYYGQMQTADFFNDRYEEKRERCIEKDAKGKCTKHEDYRVHCTHRSFRAEVFPSLVKVRSGEVVYSTRRSATTETRWCHGEQQPIADVSLIDGALNTIIAGLRPDLAPYNTVLQATVIEKNEGLSEADAKAFDAAVKAAGKGDLSSACQGWSAIERDNGTHAWTIYNLGVCAEANGDFAGALSRYQRAQSLAPKADSDLTASIDRVQNLIAAQNELNRTQRRR